MQTHSVSSFERSLRTAVRRLAKGSYDASIQEVVEHHEDLYAEILSKGISEKEATIEANRRIGLVGDIARKIVDSPSRCQKGIRLQALGVALWVLAPFLSLGLVMQLRSFAQEALTAPLWLILVSGLFSAKTICIVAGLVVGVGVFRSQKVSTKAVSLALCANILLIGGLYLYVSKSQNNNSTRQLRDEMLATAKLEPQYSKFETVLSACLKQGGNIQEKSLVAFRSVALEKSLPGITLTSKSPTKWMYPFSHVKRDRGQLYSMTFRSTDSLKTAQIAWWSTANSLQEDLPTMSAGRQAYFEQLRHAGSRSFDPVTLAAMAIFDHSWPLVIGLALGYFLIRCRVYRSAMFRLQRI